MGFAKGGPQARVSSPLVGCSILMISALQFFLVLLFIKEKEGEVCKAMETKVREI